MTQQSKAQRAAQHLFDAHRQRLTYAPLPDDISPATIDEAYDMQEAFQALLAPQRGAIVGYKIALTTPVMQRMVGFDAPCAGAVFESGVYHSPASVQSSDFVRLGAECEVAVRLSAGLPAAGAPYDRAGVSGAVGALMPAFELVDDRGADYANLYFLGVAADNAWNAGVVLGAGEVRLAVAGPGGRTRRHDHQRRTCGRRVRPRRAGGTRWTRWHGWPTRWQAGARSCRRECWS